MERQRLETDYETRQTGWQINQKTGLPEAVRTTYHIGHGQQLARQRLSERHAEANERSGHPTFSNRPGETNRQLAARLRADQPADDGGRRYVKFDTTTEAPAKPKRVKKVAA